MDLDDPHHVQVDVHLKYAGKSEKGEKYNFKTLNEPQTVINKSNHLLILQTFSLIFLAVISSILSYKYSLISSCTIYSFLLPEYGHSRATSERTKYKTKYKINIGVYYIS
jgi:hypothetical protein